MEIWNIKMVYHQKKASWLVRLPLIKTNEKLNLALLLGF